MVRCTGITKPKCLPPCEWTKGKGCNKAVAVEKTPTPSPATPTPSPVKIYAFLGFKDYLLKEAVEAAGHKVTYGLKPDSTYIIYKADKRAVKKVEESTLPKMLVVDFVSKYGYASDKFGMAVVAPAKSKTPSPVAAASKSKTPSPVHEPPTKKKLGKIFPNSDGEFPITSKYNLEYSEIYYKSDEGGELYNIYKQAIAILANMFVRAKDNNVKKVITQLFYSEKADKFIIPLKAKSESHPRLEDLYGVEFSYDYSQKNKFNINKDVMVLIEDYLPGDDILESIVADYSDIVLLVKV
jgi:hypothetical protein